MPGTWFNQSRRRTRLDTAALQVGLAQDGVLLKQANGELLQMDLRAARS